MVGGGEVAEREELSVLEHEGKRKREEETGQGAAPGVTVRPCVMSVSTRACERDGTCVVTCGGQWDRRRKGPAAEVPAA